MRPIKKWLVLLFCALCLTTIMESLTVGASAAPLNSTSKTVHVPEICSTKGRIIAIEDNAVIVKGEGYYSEVQVMLYEDTYFVKGSAGKLVKSDSLRIGDEVTVYYSAMATRSLPPQSRAYALILGKNSENLPMYFPVAKVDKATDGLSVRVLNSNGDLIATIDGKACLGYAKIKKGDKLLIWCQIMTMSLPGLTNAEKAIILKAK